MKRTPMKRGVAGARRILALRPGEPVPDGQPRRYRNSQGYIRLRWKTADGYLETYEHRVVDGVVTRAEHVHHKNHQRDDNRPENLRQLTAAQHADEHGKAARQKAARAVRLYEQGLSTTAIGARLRVDPSHVTRYLKAAGVTARRKSDYARTIDQAELLERYTAGQGYVRIARDLGVSDRRVKAALESAGVALRPGGRIPSGIPTATRAGVHKRDQGCCVRCGQPAPRSTSSIHHRKPRRMGGTRDPQIHALSNLVLLCGSGTTGCHGWIESHRAEAKEHGWLISQFEAAAPETIPLRWPDERQVWLHDDGTKTTAYITPDRSATHGH